jgi:hypothetical protein
VDGAFRFMRDDNRQAGLCAAADIVFLAGEIGWKCVPGNSIPVVDESALFFNNSADADRI